MDDFNGLPTPTKVEAPLGADDNITKDKRDWTISNNSVIGIMVYLTSKIILDIYFAINHLS